MKFRFPYRSVTLACMLTQTLNVHADFAQQIPSLPNVFDPGRIAGQVQESLPRQGKAAPAPQVQTPKPEVTNNADKIQFRLNKINLVGNTVFSKKELEKIFKPYFHKTISLEKLQNLVHSVTIKYRENGYILTRAILPPQTIKDGIVKVQVIEGFVGDIALKGDSGRAAGLLQNYGHHVMASRPLKIQVLERYALLANDLPGYSVQFILTPSKNKPAAADLTFVTTRKKASAFVSQDNFGTRYIGPNETSIGASLYSIFAAGDNNTIRITETSRKKQLQYVDFTHTQPLGSKGLRWLLDMNYAETRPGFILAPLDIVGRNAQVTTDFSYPWVRDRSKNLIFHLGANYQNITSLILDQPFYQDRIRSVIAGLAYENVDSHHGANSMGFDVTHGMPIWGAHDHFLQSRPRGTSTYTRFNGNLSRTQILNTRFTLYGALHAQYAFTTLLATEQFGFGGPDYGRGYDPSEIVGDVGIAGKAELRFDANPAYKFLQSIQYYAFYDIGDIWNRDKTNLIPQQSASSAGVGARIGFISQVSANVFFAKPLTRPVAVLLALGRNGNPFRIFFQVTATV